MSADDTSIAYIDDTFGNFNVIVQPLAGGPARRLTAYTEQAVRWVAWHPDGRSLVYLADRGGTENAQLYRIDADGGVPEALTDAPDAQFLAARGAAFSPDGRFLAYTGTDRSPGDQDVLVRNWATGEVTRAYAGGGRVVAGSWSPDGSRLTVVHFVEPNSHHVVYVVSRDGGAPIRLVAADRVATFWPGPWLSDGSGFLVGSNENREFTGLGVMNATTGDVTWLDTPDWEVDEFRLSADGRVLVWTVNVDGASELRARDLTTGADLPLPTLPTGDVTTTAVSGDGRFAVVLVSTPTRPSNVVVVDLSAGAVRWLTDVRPTAANPTTFVEPAVVRFPSRDGTSIPAHLYRPNGGDEPVGVVISIHGGPAGQDRRRYMNDGFYQYLAYHGIAVLAPNIRGSWGYGSTYAYRIYHDWGGVDLDDIAGAAAFLAGEPWVDADRIGLYGASYGGFVALSCAARLPEFRWAATVADRAPTNLLTLARAAPPALRSMIPIVIGDPDTEADFLLSRSPITYADDIRSPLLVIQGANDPRVPMRESDQIAERMRDRGVEFRREIYPDEGHGYTKAGNHIRAMSDAADFLIRHIARR